MRRATLLLLALAATSLLEGCFTYELWSAPDGDLDLTAAEVVTWSRTHDEGFRVVVRYSDDSERSFGLREEPGLPLELLRGIDGVLDDARAAALVRLAVRRGLVSRAFADDPRFARLAGERDFQAAGVAPLVSPTFTVGPTSSELYRTLLLRGDDGETIRVQHLRPEWSDPGVGDVVLVALGTPFTFVLDVVTSPVQAVLFLILLDIGEAVGGAGAHH